VIKKVFALVTFALVFQLSIVAQEKWKLKVHAGTNYAIPKGIFDKEQVYTNNKTWYPGIEIGTTISYNVLPWLAIQSGLNFERIRTGYQLYSSSGDSGGYGSGHTGGYGTGVTTSMVKYHYSKNYLNVPLHLVINTSSNFGLFGGVGYRFSLNEATGYESNMEWSELIYTGGFFVNIDRITTNFSYTQGAGKKDALLWYSPSKTICFKVAYTLWKK